MRACRYIRQLENIKALGPWLESLSDDQLKTQTAGFRKRLKEGESLDDLLPEAFALVREAAWRVLRMRHYDVQLVSWGTVGGVYGVWGYSPKVVLGLPGCVFCTGARGGLARAAHAPLWCAAGELAVDVFYGVWAYSPRILDGWLGSPTAALVCV